MERVTEALQRARADMAAQEAAGNLPAARLARENSAKSDALQNRKDRIASLFKRDQGWTAANTLPDNRFTQIELDASLLEASRIVALNSASPQTRSYDMLRNQLLNTIDEGAVHTIAVTSPTPGCGVTVTAANLAFSFARMRAMSVLLVDVNPKDPGIAHTLGLPRYCGSAEDDSAMSDALIRIEVGGIGAHVLQISSAAGASPGPQHISTVIGRAMQDLKPSVVILDLPPMLTDDEAIPLVLEADSVLLVLAVGQSKVSDLEACKTYLNSKEGVQVVLNKNRWHGL